MGEARAEQTLLPPGPPRCIPAGSGREEGRRKQSREPSGAALPGSPADPAPLPAASPALIPLRPGLPAWAATVTFFAPTTLSLVVGVVLGWGEWLFQPFILCSLGDGQAACATLSFLGRTGLLVGTVFLSFPIISRGSQMFAVASLVIQRSHIKICCKQLVVLSFHW